MIDLLLHNVKSLHCDSLLDVGIENGKIVYLSNSKSEVPNSKQIIEGNGNVLLPGLVESHIHLDKAFLLDKMNEDATNLNEAIKLTAQLKQGFTKEDIRERSLKVLKRCVDYGVTHMRCHVEVDPIIQMKSMEVHLELKEQLKDLIDLQIVVFPQEGIFKQKGTADLMRESLIMGADVVGGIPYNDRDPIEHLNFVYQLANEFGKPLDFHVDFSDDPNQLAILDIIKLTHLYQMEGRVAVGHLTSLGSVEHEKARQIASKMAKEDIHVFSLPATDLYLNGRGDTERVRRGLTPVKLLLEEGVNVLYGTNNIRNPFTPFGTGNPLDIALLLAHSAQMGTSEDAKKLLEMTTYGAARALGLTSYGIEVGKDADLVLFDSKDIRNVLLDRPKRLCVWKKGKEIGTDSIRSLIKVN
ncbi:amidohydrolase family protein [Terrilactibacillus laevilacticus]|uniref:amidohydrolase family protein n=1 Tax=Terrilactibacillus laevilacticus TaxID=1380157 RepID=UPI00114770B8|nr:amidohydrolase family protein [Terrilactibacillus laevilacticus]